MNKVFSRPILNELLSQLDLDKHFHKSFENSLYYKEEGNEIEVCDFLGGYGSTLLGHNNQILINHFKELLDKKTPMHSQMSIKKNVDLLAQKISENIEIYTGNKYITTFANSGAEAVEGAVKHAKLNLSRKIDEVKKRVKKEFHKINNFYSKNSKEFNVNYRGALYSDVGSFTTFFENQIQNQINESSIVMLAAKNSYHGKTSFALKLTFNEGYKKPFKSKTDKGKYVYFFDFTEEDFLEKLNSLRIEIEFPKLNPKGEIIFSTKTINTCLGVIVEPIQGEGGVIKTPIEVLKFIKEQTSKHGVPFIFDEIQCGFYRTGTFLYSQQLGVDADYYLLGKSIGGGLVKNAAIIINQKQYIPEFGLLHTSTFVDDEITAQISLKSIEIAEDNLDNISVLNDLLFTKLNQLKTNTSVIKEVRGVGLMWGVEFESLDETNLYGFQVLSRASILGYVYSSFLLNKFNIRVGLTLSNPNTIRIQPSIFVDENQIDKLCVAIANLCEIIEKGDLYKLIEHLLPEEYQNLRSLQDFNVQPIFQEEDANAKSVAFLTHFMDIEGVKTAIPSLDVLPDNEIENLLKKIILTSPSPGISSRQIITSGNGKKVNLLMIGIPFTAKMFKDVYRSKDRQQIRIYQDLCQRAVDVAANKYNCKIIGLGQYTSIITFNGTTISSSNIAVTTGNSYTVGIGVQSIVSEIESRNKSSVSLGVVGAGGNIISTYIVCLLEYSRDIVLKGSDSEEGVQKAELNASDIYAHIVDAILSEEIKVSEDLQSKILNSTTYQKIKNNSIDLKSYYTEFYQEFGEEAPIRVVKQLDDLQKCDVTIVATSSPDPFLFSKYFAENSVVYDVSVPSNCSDELVNNDKNISVLLGGIVKLPSNEEIFVKGFPLSKGEAFACMSETILLGMEENFSSFSYGKILPKQVEEINRIGSKHGFEYLKPKKQKVFD